MQIPDDQCIQLFRFIGEVKDHLRTYSLEPFAIPVSVEDFKWALEEILQAEIIVHSSTSVTPQSFIRGSYARLQNNKHVILVNDNQDESWKRYTAVKELCHVFLDNDPAAWTTNVQKTVDDLFMLPHLEQASNGTHQPGQVILSENLAEVAAMMILYPEDLREPDSVRLQEERTSFSKLALRYQIPEVIVRRILHSSFKRFCDDVNAASSR